MKKRVTALVAALMVLLSVESFAATLKLWHGWTGKTKEIMEASIAKYEKASGNKIEVLAVPFDALQNKFATMAAQGEGPDVLTGPADWVGPLVMQKLLEPVDGYIAEKDRKSFIPSVLSGGIYTGKLYGVPITCNVAALIYNKDLVPEPPKNTDELIQIGKSLTNVNETKYGLVYDKGNYYFHIGWIGGFGGNVLDKKNNPTFTSDAQIKAANFVRLLSDKENKIIPDEIDYNLMMTLFNTGKAGMMINGPWVVGDLQKAGIKFGIARIPMVSSTKKWPAPIVGPELVMMSSKTKDKKKTYDFIKFMTSADIQAQLVKAGSVPARLDVYDMKSVKEDKNYDIIMGFKSQAEVATPMPTAPEMGAAVWTNGATMLSKVLTGQESAESAAKTAQAKADETVKELRAKK